jgi:WD40 repeat protein/serine/threonine protein kinase
MSSEFEKSHPKDEDEDLSGTSEIPSHDSSVFDRTIQLPGDADADFSEAGEPSGEQELPQDRTIQLPEGLTPDRESAALDESLHLDKTVQLSEDEGRDPNVTANPSGEGFDRPAAGVDSHLQRTVVESDFPSPQGPPGTPGTPDIERTVRLDLDSQEFRDVVAAGEMGQDDRELWSQIASNAETAVKSGMALPQKSEHSSGMETNLLLLSRKLQEKDPKIPGMMPDYEIVRQLGRGGMGTVYSARQASLDRTVAVKVIQPLSEAEKERLRNSGRLAATERTRREQFLSEAVVTGDLDHPNIVPIHDIAKTHDGDLFYSMKQVVGTPWDKVIARKTLDENLEILMKMADAVAFAHSRGVVHRDIKPENVMLGDFGVVMLMDWGLAVPRPEFKKVGTVRQTTSLGGSPAYMAPELALGPIARITPASDIYLLGAVLFQIITGDPPHSASNLSQCIRAAAENRIVDVPIEKQGELYHIAMKAMATDQAERYKNVQQFQEAIRRYRSHSESISLSERAAADLEMANRTQDYADFARAVFGYEEALELWKENLIAARGLRQARLAYAEAANTKEDFDLGLSLLSEKEPEFLPMINRLKQGQHERQSRRDRLRNLRRMAAVLLLIIFVGGGGLSYTIWTKNAELTAAIVSKENADRLKNEAEMQAEVANRARTKALAEAAVAEQNAQHSIALAKETVANAEAKVATLDLQLAEKQQEVAKAEANLQKAEKASKYETYLSQISLARTRIEQNQYDEARRILNGIEPKTMWEWRRLWYEVNRSQAAPSALQGNPSGRSVAFSRSGDYAIATFEDGSVELLTLNGDAQERTQQVPVEFPATTAAISPDAGRLAIGGADGTIQLLDAQTKQSIWSFGDQAETGHREPVRALTFLNDRWLVSGSQDKTIRLWDVATGKEQAVGWHIDPVLAIDAAPRGESFLVACAASDNTNGRVVIWHLNPAAGSSAFEHRGDFMGHHGPVDAVAVSPDSKTIASGDRGGQIFLWQSDDVQPLDYQSALVSAVESVKENRPVDESALRAAEAIPFIELMDPEIFPGQMHLVSAKLSNAHLGTIDGLRFRPDGRQVVSASDDFTLKVWDIPSASLVRTLRGHGGRVQAGAFSPADPDFILSAGNTGLRRWNLALMDEEIIQRPGDSEKDEVHAHSDEIWSARFDATGNRLVTASRDHTSRVLEIDPQTLKFKEIATLRENEAPAGQKGLGVLAEGGDYISLSMMPDERNLRLVVGGSDGMVRIWNVARATEEAVLPNTGLNSSLALSRDGRLVLTGSSNPEVRAQLWTLDENGKPVGDPRILLDGAHQPVTAFAISADGTTLFTGGKQGECALWDSSTGKSKMVLRPHGTSRINAAVFSHDGRTLFLASDDRTISRTDLSTQQSESLSHEGFVTDLALAPDGRHLMCLIQIPRAPAPGSDQARSESQVLLWNLENPKAGPVTVWKEPNFGMVYSVRFGFDSNIAMTTHLDADSQRSIVRVWQVNPDAAPVLSHTFRFPRTLAVAECAFPAAGNKMFSLNGDAAFLWDLQSLGHLISYRAHGAVTEAAFSPSGKYVATASRSIKIWDVKTQQSLCKLEFPHEGAVRSTQFSPIDDLLFASGGDDGRVGIWKWNPEAGTSEQLRSFVLGPGKVHQVRFSADGSRIMAVGEHGAAAIWKVDGTGEAISIRDDQAGDADFLCCTISPTHDAVVVGGDDRIARMWSIGPGWQNIRLSKHFQGHADAITGVAIMQTDPQNPASFRVVTTSRDKSVRVWDPKLGDATAPREILNLRRHTLGVTAVDVTRGGNLLMTAGLDGNVILWPSVGGDRPAANAVAAD